MIITKTKNLIARINIIRYEEDRFCIEQKTLKEPNYPSILTEDDPLADLPNDKCTIMTDCIDHDFLVKCGIAKKMEPVDADPNDNGGDKFDCYEIQVADGVYDVYDDNTYQDVSDNVDFDDPLTNPTAY